MSALLIWLLLTPQEANSVTSAEKKVEVRFKTSRKLPPLEKCLYAELSDLGEATFMRSPGETILMVRNGEGPPLLVDIVPPAVTITTRSSSDVQSRVRRCV